MSEQFDQRTRARVQALHTYTIALEQGDIDTIAQVLRQAEQDAALERMILELHTAALISPQPDHQNVPVVRDQEETATERTPDMASTFINLDGTYPRSRIRHTKRTRLTALLQALAAVLIIGALVASFALLLTHHPGAVDHPGRGKPSHPVQIKPTVPPTQNQPVPTYKSFYATVATNNGTVYALQSLTGDVVWSYNTHQEVDTMVQQGNNVFVATSGSGTRPNYLYKFTLSDGKLLWEKNFPQLYGFSTIVVGNGAVAINGGEGDGSVDIVSAQNGSLLWRYVPNFGPNASIPADPIIGVQNNVIFLTVMNGTGAFELTTGKHLWTSTAQLDGIASKGNVVYFITNTSIIALNINNGHEIGIVHFPSQQNIIAFDYDANALYATKIIEGGTEQICALSFSNGALLWCSPEAQSFSLITPAALTDDVLSYIQVSQDNHWTTYAVNTSNGSSRWHWTNGSVFKETNDLNTVAFGGIVFVTTPQGFYGLTAGDGHVLWHSLKGVHPALFALPSVPDQTPQLPN